MKDNKNESPEKLGWIYGIIAAIIVIGIGVGVAIYQNHRNERDKDLARIAELNNEISEMETEREALRLAELKALEEAQRKDSLEKVEAAKRSASYDALLVQYESAVNLYNKYNNFDAPDLYDDFFEKLSAAYKKSESIHDQLLKVVNELSPEQLKELNRIENKISTPLFWG